MPKNIRNIAGIAALSTLMILCGFLNFGRNSTGYKWISDISESETSENYEKYDESEEKESGPDVERKYFEQLHYPYGSVLPANILDKIWSDIKSMPNERELSSSGTNWISLGPNGMQVPATNTKYTGRILDINVSDTSNIIVASASGGLWKAGNPPIPLTEHLNSQVASSFDVQPGNSNVIILGTGEPFMRAGTGFYKTTNGGLNWVRVLVSDSSTAYKVRYSSTNVVHASSQNGYYRSDDNGTSWTKYFTGNISDFAVNPINNNIVYCCRWNSTSGGVYKTTDAGSSWTRMENGIPFPNAGRTSIAIAPGFPSFVYVLMATQDGDMRGVFRTASNDVWSNVSPSADIFGGLGGYANTIAVNPTNFNDVVIGGLWLWRTHLGGVANSWNQISNVNVHADQHSIAWHSSGLSVWIGNDGGLSFSRDSLNTINTLNNNWPITQFNTIDFSQSNPGIIIGGSQDNGTSSTTDGGLSWSNPQHNLDGSGTAVNPLIPSEWYTTTGVYGGSWAFQRRRTTDSGLNWVAINSGVDPSIQWWTKIKTDNTDPINVFTNSSHFLYYSTNKGDNWIKRNTSQFPDLLSDFSVREYADTSIIYVCIESNDDASRLFVQTGTGAFTEVSGDIPSGLYIQAVAMNQNNSSTAYAVIRGMSFGHKVYKTVNRGVNWINITSNLPNIPAMCIAPHPSNDSILYLGSEMGCFKSSNGGSNWFRWNDEMPEAAIVTDLKSYISGGEFYILAGTYGRGVWKRKDDDLVILPGISQEIPDKFLLHQNYPNPFNPVTNINFSVPKKSFVKLVVYDALGREVAVLIDSELHPGTYKADFDGTNLSTGVYFYKLTADNFTGVKKMMLIK